ncbi:MAG: F0F1 ATP synthase subunit A [Acidobacteria bacterium]|nr:F0F1 ATP synthase subunit A [Acidobacteriota bacterium]
MHQEVSILTLLINSIFHVQIPDQIVMTTLVFIISIVVFVLMRKTPELVPGPAQQFYEGVLKAMDAMLLDNIGKRGRQFLPFITALGIFIFISNTIGLIPGLTPATGNLNTTAACAVAVFIYYNYHGFKEHGLGYLEQFIAPKGPLALRIPMSILFIPIEIISHLARPFSLAIRLFVNMVGDHIVLGVFLSLVPFLIPIPLLGLGLFVCFIQTLVFVLLAIIYLAGAVEESH